jgi:glycosidase
MLGGDRDRIEMAYSLQFSLPGTPVLFYGEEIGMGENLAAPGRAAVRTPMQWSRGPGAGFSTADPSRFPAPVAPTSHAGWPVDVASARRDPSSLLNWFERLIRRRRETPELAYGSVRVLDAGVPEVLVHRCDWEGATVVVVHNLSASRCRVRIPLDGDGDADLVALDPLLDDRAVECCDRLAELDVGRYGYHWFRARRAGHRVTP